MSQIVRKIIPYGVCVLVSTIVAALILYGFDFSFWGAPIVEGGSTPLQMLQGFLIALAGIVTLALAYWRSHTAHKQSEAALAQIELNQNQMAQAAMVRSSDQYQKALEMLAGRDSNELSRSSAIRMLQDLAETRRDEIFENVVHVLTNFVTINTHSAGMEYGRLLQKYRSENKYGIPEWPPLEEMGLDVHNALDALFGLRNTTWAKRYELNHPIKILFPEIALSYHRFEGLNLSRVSIAHGGFFEKCTFIDCNFTESVLLNLYGRDCEFINCRVDGADIFLEGGWKIESNHHAADAPPKKFKPDNYAYQSEIDQRVQQLNESFEEAEAKADEPMKRSLVYEYRNLEKTVPKLVIRNEELD